MKQIDDLLDAFQNYYSTEQLRLTYNKVQRGAIVAAFSSIGSRFKEVLYDEVIAIHPSSLRSLPDMAVLRKVANKLGNPSAYEEKKAVRQIEDSRDYKWLLDNYVKAIEEAAIRERERVRRKGKDMGLHEAWWLHCMDEHGQYRPMPENFEDKLKEA